MKYYLTKYCLTDGIREVDGEVLSPNRIKLSQGIWAVYSLNKDIFDNEEDAKNKANSMRIKKIDSLRKQLTKLEKTKF